MTRHENHIVYYFSAAYPNTHIIFQYSHTWEVAEASLVYRVLRRWLLSPYRWCCFPYTLYADFAKRNRNETA